MPVAQRIQILSFNIETIYNLEKLGNHPTADKQTAAAAKSRALYLRKKLGIPLDKDLTPKELKPIYSPPPPRTKTKEWRYKQPGTSRFRVASLYKLNDTDYLTHSKERPNEHHATFKAAHDYLTKHGYAPIIKGV